MVLTFQENETLPLNISRADDDYLDSSASSTDYSYESRGDSETSQENSEGDSGEYFAHPDGRVVTSLLWKGPDGAEGFWAAAKGGIPGRPNFAGKGKPPKKKKNGSSEQKNSYESDEY